MSSVGAVLGWMLVGGFALGALAVRQGWIDLARVPLLGRAFGRATPDTEPRPTTPPTTSASRRAAEAWTPAPRVELPPRVEQLPSAAPFVVIDRLQLGASTIFAAQDALQQRWPDLERFGSEAIAVGDRVGVLVERGSSPPDVARVLASGRVLELQPDALVVALDERDASGPLVIPRAAVLGWARAATTQRSVALAWRPEPDQDGLFVRHVEPEQVVTLPLPETRGRLSWSTQPAVDLRVVEVVRGQARVMLGRGAPSGRVLVQAFADAAPLGRWSFQVRGW